MKKAFTLAEIMIVLSVVGVLAGILVPVAVNSAPDEEVIKIKKANTTLAAVVSELVHSDKYYANGDLGTTAAGAAPSTTHFCNAFGDIVGVKAKKCSSTTFDTGKYVTSSQINSIDNSGSKRADSICSKAEAKVGVEIITNDGIRWYQASPGTTFATKIDGKRLFANPNSSDAPYVTKGGYDDAYKVICVDIDKANEGVAPFGFGVRADGKIIPGGYAKKILNKKVKASESDSDTADEIGSIGS